MATRNSKRVRTFAMLVKNVDNDQRQMRVQNKLDVLESDYYESPNKLAEDELSDSDGKKQTKASKLVKKTKVKHNNLRKNVNLKKMMKTQVETSFPHFNAISPRAQPQQSRFCSICRGLAKYTCPRCMERYCSVECSTTHKEIQCLRIEY